MHEFCENPYCENPAVKEVPVSVDSPADQVRPLCAACEESYTWGVQHGRMTPELDHVDGFLLKGGFVVVGRNRSDPCPSGPFEAWAYAGPLGFDSATPVVFGLGKDCRQAQTYHPDHAVASACHNHSFLRPTLLPPTRSVQICISSFLFDSLWHLLQVSYR